MQFCGLFFFSKPQKYGKRSSEFVIVRFVYYKIQTSLFSHPSDSSFQGTIARFSSQTNLLQRFHTRLSHFRWARHIPSTDTHGESSSCYLLENSHMDVTNGVLLIKKQNEKYIFEYS